MPDNEGAGGNVDIQAACTLILVRHGETEWNRGGRYQGQQDIPLSDAGMRQAARLAARLRRERDRGAPVAAVYSSDLARTRRTAEPIADALGLTLRLEPDLREMCYGRWEGLTRAEIAEAFPDEYDRWMSGVPGAAPSGGESAETCADRSVRRLSRIAGAHRGRRVVVVTHGGPIRASLARLMGMPLSNRGRLVTDNASMHIVETDGRKSRVVALNDTCHLRS